MPSGDLNYVGSCFVKAITTLLFDKVDIQWDHTGNYWHDLNHKVKSSLVKFSLFFFFGPKSGISSWQINCFMPAMLFISNTVDLDFLSQK